MSTLLSQLTNAWHSNLDEVVEPEHVKPVFNTRLETYEKAYRRCLQNEREEAKRARVTEPWIQASMEDRSSLEITPHEQFANLKAAVHRLNGVAYKSRLPPLHWRIMWKYMGGILKGLFKDEFEENLPDFIEELGEYPNEYVIITITRRMGKTVSLTWFMACCMWALLDFHVCCFAVAQRQTIAISSKMLYFLSILSNNRKPVKKTVEKVHFRNMYPGARTVSSASFYPSRVEIEFRRRRGLLSLVRGKYRASARRRNTRISRCQSGFCWVFLEIVY